MSIIIILLVCNAVAWSIVLLSRKSQVEPVCDECGQVHELDDITA